MKKITIKDIDEIIFYDKLDNGLEIFMLPNEKVNNIYVTFTTKYGSAHNEFMSPSQKKMVKVPNGIAHFLEHKMFEQEDGIDPFAFFGSKGTDVNAFTSLFNTSYLFYGPNHLEENINYLLDYVQTPYLTDDNVAKEKGIIEQEINMYEDDPYYVLDDGIRLISYQVHPARYSIGGTVKDIKSITKEQLLECYNTFYHPSNMFLIITGNFCPKQAHEVIKQNQIIKKYSKINKIIVKEIDEPNEVFKEYGQSKLNIEIPKLAFSVKIPVKSISLNKRKTSHYIFILFDILFGSTAHFTEKMKELEYLDSSIVIDAVHTDNHIVIALTANTKKPHELAEEIKQHLTKIKIEKADFERKKKVIISSKIYLFENIKSLNHFLLGDIIKYGSFDNNMLKLLKDLSYSEFQSLIKKIDFRNTATYIVKSLSEK